MPRVLTLRATSEGVRYSAALFNLNTGYNQREGALLRMLRCIVSRPTSSEELKELAYDYWILEPLASKLVKPRAGEHYLYYWFFEVESIAKEGAERGLMELSEEDTEDGEIVLTRTQSVSSM